MSVVFYGYRIPKNEWWDFSERVRNFYKKNSILFKKYVVLGQDIGTNNLATYYDKVTKNIKEEIVEIQLFDIDNDYVFRVLESGYFFMNNHLKIIDGYTVSLVYYDGRSDVSEEEEANLPLIDVLDQQITDRKYFIYSVVSDEDLIRAFMDGLDDSKLTGK